jgi:hypothetical protein
MEQPEKILLTATEKKCEELGGVKQCKINQSINHTIKQQIIHGSHSLLFFVGMIKKQF